jgi:hypothetical protein
MTNISIGSGAVRSIAAHGPAIEAIQRCLELQDDVKPLGPVARAFGRSPLSDESREWFDAAVGELEVAVTLERLGSGWVVFHATQGGTEDSRVDHVLIGPGGVFAIVSKAHVGQQVFAAGSTLTADGVKQSHLRIAAQVAGNAEAIIEKALDEHVDVTPVVVIAGAHSLTLGSTRPTAEVLNPMELGPFLQRQRRVLSDETVAKLVRVAGLRPNLSQTSIALNDVVASSAKFAQLQHRVDVAIHRSRVWTAAAALGVLMLLTVTLVKFLPNLGS